jgi:hypothetical protein
LVYNSRNRLHEIIWNEMKWGDVFKVVAMIVTIVYEVLNTGN